MKKLGFYEFAGVLAPGAVTVYGLSRLYPQLGILAPDEKVSFGELGLLLIFAFVAGHLIQSVGVFIETLWWKISKGPPTDWIRTGKHGLLASAQRAVLPRRIRELCKIQCPDNLNDISKSDWGAIRRQVYASVRKAGRAERVDIFNANYGMFRGVAGSLVVILIAAFHEFGCVRWKFYLILLALLGLTVFRMHRFGINYIREMFIQFLDTRAHELPTRAPEEEA